MPDQPAAKNRARCQVHGCNYDLTCEEARFYYYRKRICPSHMQALVVKCAAKGGVERCYRFCQQCGRMQPLRDFVGNKRSCQYSLNRRRAHVQSVAEAAKAKLAARKKTSNNTGTKKGSSKVASTPAPGTSSSSSRKDQEDYAAAGGVPRRTARPSSRRHHPYSDPAAAAAGFVGGCTGLEGLTLELGAEAGAGCVEAVDQAVHDEICSPRGSSNSTARSTASGAMAALQQTPLQGSAGLVQHSCQQQYEGSQHTWVSAQPKVAHAPAPAAMRAAAGVAPGPSAVVGFAGQQHCEPHQQQPQWMHQQPVPARSGSAACWQQQQQQQAQGQLLPVMPITNPNNTAAAAAAAGALAIPGNRRQLPEPHSVPGLRASQAQANLTGHQWAQGSSGLSLEAQQLSGPLPTPQQPSGMVANRTQSAAAGQLAEAHIFRHSSGVSSADQVPTLMMDTAAAVGRYPSVYTAPTSARPESAAGPAAAAAFAAFAGDMCYKQQQGKGNITGLLDRLLAEMEAEAAFEAPQPAPQPDLAQLIEAELQQAIAEERAKVQQQREMTRAQQFRSQPPPPPALQQQQQVLYRTGSVYGSYSTGTAFHPSAAAGSRRRMSWLQDPVQQQQQQQQQGLAASGCDASGDAAQLLADWFTASDGSKPQSYISPEAAAAAAAAAGVAPLVNKPIAPAAPWVGSGSFAPPASAGGSSSGFMTAADSRMLSAGDSHHLEVLQQQLLDPNMLHNMQVLKQYLISLPEGELADKVVPQGMQLVKLGQQLATCVDQLKGLLSEVSMANQGGFTGEGIHAVRLHPIRHPTSYKA